MTRKLLLSFVAILVCHIASSQDNGGRITVQISNEPLLKAIQVVEDVSPYSFFYDADKIDLAKRVSLSADSLPIKDAMQQMLSPIKMKFEIKGEQIVLIPTSESTDAIGVPGTINVTVLDKDNYPVIGAAVLKADGSGSVTDIDGNCAIEVSSTDKSLTITCLGYQTKTMQVGMSSAMTVYLEEESLALDALVVVGYGSQKKGNLTGAISVVDSEAISGRSQSSLSNLLQGIRHPAAHRPGPALCGGGSLRPPQKAGGTADGGTGPCL